MVISIEELEILFKLVIKKLRNDKAFQFELDIDEYWIILTKEWDNLDAAPEPAVGSLVDDVEYLKRTIDEDEINTYSDLDRLASLLRAISEKQAPSV